MTEHDDHLQMLIPIYPDHVKTLTTSFNAKNYSNHQELEQGSVVVFRSHQYAKWTEESDAFGTLCAHLGKQSETDLIVQTADQTTSSADESLRLYRATDFASFVEDESSGTVLTSSSHIGSADLVVASTTTTTETQLSDDDQPVKVFRSHGFTKWTEETDAYGTLRSSGSKQADVDLVMPHVRRLMPIECERLQGFPDDWTAGQADTPRYKQMGNAVAVPVVEWILRRITEIEATHNDA